jgi:hypothetical protein
MVAADPWSEEAASSSADAPTFDSGSTDSGSTDSVSTDESAGADDEHAVSAPAQLASSGGRWRSRGSVG